MQNRLQPFHSINNIKELLGRALQSISTHNRTQLAPEMKLFKVFIPRPRAMTPPQRRRIKVPGAPCQPVSPPIYFPDMPTFQLPRTIYDDRPDSPQNSPASLTRSRTWLRRFFCFA